jgi:hypothetical protein
MDTDDHNRIIEQAFGSMCPIPEFRLPPHDVMLLKQASADADNLFTGQTRDASFKHAMRSWGQTPAEAEAKFKEWVQYCLNLAADLQKGGSHKAAIQRLGLGMHALADSKSPTHVGFQSWGGDGPLNIPAAIWHHINEKPSADSMKDAIRELRYYYYIFRIKAGLA